MRVREHANVNQTKQEKYEQKQILILDTVADPDTYQTGFLDSDTVAVTGKTRSYDRSRSNQTGSVDSDTEPDPNQTGSDAESEPITRFSNPNADPETQKSGSLESDAGPVPNQTGSLDSDPEPITKPDPCIQIRSL